MPTICMLDAYLIVDSTDGGLIGKTIPRYAHATTLPKATFPTVYGTKLANQLDK